MSYAFSDDDYSQINPSNLLWHMLKTGRGAGSARDIKWDTDIDFNGVGDYLFSNELLHDVNDSTQDENTANVHNHQLQPVFSYGPFQETNEREENINAAGNAFQ
eukprot:389609_1